MAVHRRKRRRRRGHTAGMIVLVLLVAVAGYITYIAFTQPERLSVGLFNRPETAPVSAEAAETGDASDETTPGSEIDLTGGQADASDAVDTSGPDDSTETLRTEDPNEMPDNPYQSFSYYIPDKLSEYETYQDEHPELSAEEVTWQVNAGLNLPLYDNATVISDKNPLLINPYNRLPDDFIPTSLVTLDDYGRQATPDTINAFLQMRKGANRDGLDISVQSAYRTMEYQRGLYERAGGDGAVARPGYSEHHTGRALDLWGPDGLLDERTTSDEGRWVAEHAHEYGFIIRYTEENQSITGYIPEPWHITYVGSTIARAMRNQSYGSLEEYVAKNPGASLP